VSWIASLEAAASAHGVAPAGAKLTAFVRLFARWNQKINLSAARTEDEIAQHVVDCLALVRFLRESDSVIDVGSGGGLPGLIIAISMDKIVVDCVEPTHKKAAFLSTPSRELGLTTEVHARRVDPAIDGGHAAAISRATFDLASWLVLGAQLVRPGGIVLGMEARDQLALGPHDERHPYTLGDRTRAIIIRRVP
jgi:16S rRNA (guanine527-N7)-methyltransferase